MFRVTPIILLLALVASSGCGGPERPPLARVTGSVTIDGKPLADATVRFTPEEGRPSTGVTDSNGKFELVYTADSKGAMLGKHTIRIEPQTTDDDLSEEEDQARRAQFPAKAQDGTLSFEVKAGSNEVEIEL